MLQTCWKNNRLLYQFCFLHLIIGHFDQPLIFFVFIPYHDLSDDPNRPITVEFQLSAVYYLRRLFENSLKFCCAGCVPLLINLSIISIYSIFLEYYTTMQFNHRLYIHKASRVLLRLNFNIIRRVIILLL